jgi:hypothetical protein
MRVLAASAYAGVGCTGLTSVIGMTLGSPLSHFPRGCS